MSTCRFNGRTEPRTLPGRHDDPCAGEECPGCAPCTDAHCQVCGHRHAEQTCPECLGETRDNLLTLGALCDMDQGAIRLLTEAVHAGPHSEAMTLLGPVHDPESWRHHLDSVHQGRLPRGWLEEANHERHPMAVLGTWEMLWREHRGTHTELRATLSRLVGHLSTELHHIAAEPDFPFAQMAGEIRSCLAHVEAVLHDSGQGDRANVGCFDCGRDLERRLATTGFEDHWTCRGCRRRYTYAEYNFALRATLEDVINKEAG